MDELEEIYREYFRGVYLYLLSMTQNESLSEELAQETMLRAVMNINSFRGGSAIFSWLCRIAKNLYIDWLRKNQRVVSIDDMEAEPADSNDIVIKNEEKETARRILTEVERLDEPYKQVFMLRVFGDMKFEKISRRYNKSDGWARVVYYRAKVQIIEALRSKGEII